MTTITNPEYAEYQRTHRPDQVMLDIIRRIVREEVQKLLREHEQLRSANP